MKQNITIIGPIGDFGGRELETGFIAKTLGQEDADVSVISTTYCSSNSQIFDFIDQSQLSLLDDIVLQQSVLFRVLAKLSYWKAGKKKPIANYASNTYSKKLGYRKQTISALSAIISKSDLVVICAQISSAYVKEIVEFAHKFGIPVVLRTSSKISESDQSHKDWLEKVSLFIHHSESNASRLAFLQNYNYEIIDQCTFREEEMLKIKQAGQFKNLLFIGRLSPEKGISELINAFKKYGQDLNLTVIGDGPLNMEIKELSASAENIKLLGYKTQDEVLEYIKASDTIIISSLKESGPLVGLEAMASARVIISTKVGAMPYRLKNTMNQFWFNIEEPSSLELTFDRLRRLTEMEISKIAIKNREVYLSNYRKNTLEILYKKSIFSLLTTKPKD